MSEFSDSVHLFGVTAQAAAAALAKVGGGVVLASNGRTTSLVMPWGQKPALLETQPGYTLDYSYGGGGLELGSSAGVGKLRGRRRKWKQTARAKRRAKAGA